MKQLNSISYEGIMKYGKEKDFDDLIRNCPEILERKYDLLSLAVKNRNSEMIKRLLCFCERKGIKEFLSNHEGLNLFGLAYYQLDDVVELFFNFLSAKQLKKLAELRYDQGCVFTLRLSIRGYSRIWEPLNPIFSNIIQNQYTLILYVQQLYKILTGDNQSYLTAKYKLDQPFKSDTDLFDFIHTTIAFSCYMYKEEFIRIALALNLFPSNEYLNILLTKHQKIEMFKIYLENKPVHILEKLRLTVDGNQLNMQKPNEEVMMAYFNMLAVKNSSILLEYSLNDACRADILSLLFSHGHFSLYFAMLFNQSNESLKYDILMNFEAYLSPLMQVTLLFTAIFIGKTELGFIPINSLFFKDNDYADFKWLHYSLLKSIEISKQFLQIMKLPKFPTGSVIDTIFKELTEIYLDFCKTATCLNLKITLTNDIQSLLDWVSGFERILLYSNLITCIYESIEIQKSSKFNELMIVTNYEPEECCFDGVILVSINYLIENESLKLIDSDYYYKKRLDFQEIKARIKEISDKIQICILVEEVNELRQLEGLNHFIRCNSEITLHFITDIRDYNQNLSKLVFDESAPMEVIQCFNAIKLLKQIEMVYSKDLAIVCPAYSSVIYTVIEQQENGKYFNFRKNEWILYYHCNYSILIEKESFLPYLIYKLRMKFEFMHSKRGGIKNISFNYQKFIDNIAYPLSKMFNISIATIFDIQTQWFLDIISYIQLFAMNLIGIKALFIDFSTTMFSVSKHGDLLVFYFPYIIKNNSTLSECLSLYSPSIDSVNEDFLVYTHSPEEVFNHVVDAEAYNKLLNYNQNSFGFSFVINWDSIKSYFIPHLISSGDYGKYIKLLQMFNRELMEKLSLLYFHKVIVNTVWCEAILINSFKSVSDSLTINKINPEERFYQGAMSRKGEFIYSHLKPMFHLVGVGNVRSTERLEVEDLMGDSLIYISNSNGSVFCVPSSVLPSLSADHKRVIMPEAGNILKPFPDVLSISLNEADDISLELSEVANCSEKICECDLIRINSELEFSSALKPYFWYVYSLQQEKMLNFFTKQLNSPKKYKKEVFINEDLISKRLSTKKKNYWTPKFEFNWKLFSSAEFPYSVGMMYANNIFDKFYSFLSAIDSLFNSINSNASFKNIQSNLYLLPKSSLMQKLVMKHLTHFSVIIANQDKFKISSKGLKLMISPETRPSDSSINYETSIKLLAEYVIQRELPTLNYKNLTYENDSSQRSHIEIIENLQLISQAPLIIKFCNFVSRVYLNQSSIQVELNLNSNEQFKLASVKSSSDGIWTFSLSFGRRFYNFLNAVELGEFLCREINLLRPFDSLFANYHLVKNHKYTKIQGISNEKPSSNSVQLPKSCKREDICIQKFEYSQGKPSTKSVVVWSFRGFPAYFLNIGMPIKYFSKKSSKYPAFCMRVQGDSFLPVIKPSNFLKLRIKPELFNKELVSLKQRIECFVFCETTPNTFCIKTDKNQTIKCKSSPVQNISKFTAYNAYSLTFSTSKIGNYYIFCNNKLIPSDFIVSRIHQIDPKKSFIEYNKFKDLFTVTLLSSNSERIYLNQKGKVLNSQLLRIGQQQVEIKIIDNKYNDFKVDVTAGAYSLTFSFNTQNKFDECFVIVSVDDEQINKSPYKITSSNTLKLQLKNYIFSHKCNASYTRFCQVTLKRSRFFPSLIQALKPQPANLKGEYNVYYEEEAGIDCGGLKRDFFDCLGNYASDPKWKLFQAQGDNYRIHPEADNEALYYFGCALANGIIHEYKVPISFCDSLIKILLEIEPDESDLKSQNPVFHKSLVELASYSPSELDALSLTFTADCGSKLISLCDNGKNISVNTENLAQYVKLMVKWELLGYAKEKIANFTKGFYSVAQRLKGLFSVDEFRFVMCGFEANYLEILGKTIVVNNVKLNKVKAWIMKWLEQKGSEMVKRFLKFTTGSSLIPSGHENWKIYLYYVTSKGLPVSHTCFNKLDIPCYENYEILCEKMELAIEYASEGFGLV